MEKYLISIVIPCYNVEPFIEECLNSVLNQTYQNFEIILVEDKSIDNTLEVLKKYSDSNSKITLIRNDKNLGIGISYYKGLSHIKGDYFMTLDGDDYISHNFLEELLKTAISTQSDIVSSKLYINDVEGLFEEKIINNEMSTFYSNDDKYGVFFKDKYQFMRNKLYNSRLLEKVDYCTRRFIEDTPTILKMLYYANSYSITNKAYYVYRMRNNSLTKTNIGLKYQIYKVLTTFELYDFFSDKDYNSIYNIYQLRNDVGNLFRLLKQIDNDIYINLNNELYDIKQQLILHKDLIPKNQEKYYNAFMKII